MNAHLASIPYARGFLTTIRRLADGARSDERLRDVDLEVAVIT